MKLLLAPVMRAWIPLAVAVSLGAFGLNFVAQQVYRGGANDPQVQLAQDGVRALDEGTAPESLVPSGSVDPAASLATFVMVYDEKGGLLAGNGTLSGDPIEPPAEMLATAREVGQNRTSWQASDEALVAVVVYSAKDGRTVLAGNGTLSGKPIEPPAEMLATAREVGQNRTSWQASDEALVAVVVYSAKDGRTVLAGRSLLEVENRQRSVQQVVGMGWLFTLTVTFFATWFSVKLLRDPR